MGVKCQVCMHHCNLEEGQNGKCRARKNIDGQIICTNYGRITAIALDPVEKKPLAMFCPGGMVLSVGSYGCNLNCPFCQNYEISMRGEETKDRYISPEELAWEAQMLKKAGNIGAAYTYNEPLVGYEYVVDASKLIHRMGMKNVIVTNGSFPLETLEKVLPYTDAMNIDLKGFTDAWYRKLGGDFSIVKDFIRRAAKECHVELTMLIIPGENDSEDEMRKTAGWVAGMDRKIPLHVSRFFPGWRMTDRCPTEVRTVYALAETARQYLAYVFTGNC